MKLDMSAVLKRYDGEAIKANNDKELTLAHACCEALVGNFGDEHGLSGEEKLNRHLLAARIHSSPGEVNLTVEDIALVKKLVAKMYGPVACGPIWVLLEQGSPSTR